MFQRVELANIIKQKLIIHCHTTHTTIVHKEVETSDVNPARQVLYELYPQ